MYKITEECVECGSCLTACPEGAIKEGEPYIINNRCTDCGACLEICPVEAIIPPNGKKSS